MIHEKRIFCNKNTARRRFSLDLLLIKVLAVFLKNHWLKIRVFCIKFPPKVITQQVYYISFFLLPTRKIYSDFSLGLVIFSSPCSIALIF